MEEEPQFPIFWGIQVLAEKSTAFVPPGEVDARLHLSTACLVPGCKDGARVYVRCKVQDGTPLVIAVLRAGSNEMATLDLVYDQYTEFSVEGTAAVHLTGYYMPTEDDEGDDEEDGYWRTQQGSEDGSDDEDYSPQEAAAIRQMLLQRTGGKGGLAGMSGGSEEEESSDDDEVPLAVPLDGMDEDGSEDGSDYETGSENGEQITAATSSVVIEEIRTENGAEEAIAQAATKKRKADAAALERPAAAKKTAASASKQQAAVTPSTKGAAKTPAKAAARETPAAVKKAAAVSAQKTPAAKPAQSPAAVLLEGTSTPGPTGRGVRTFPNGLKIENIAMGAPDGKLAKAGKRVKMRYCGKLTSGKIFDQTKGGATFTFRLGVGEVIKGWDKGVEGMRVGDKRKITCPPSMAYGNAGAPPTIPPKSTLVFDVELVNVM